MYIQPDGLIYVLNNVPLDPTYDHTLFLQTKAKQEEYFTGKRKYTFTNQTYQRVNKGTMRVERKADLLYDCNYLMFKNQAYGDKWFYAFILSVEYVNDLVSEITYEIDVMQTWLYDITQEWCFVERQHSTTDEPGDNLVPEGLETGEYISSDWRHSNFSSNLRIVVAATFDEDYNDSYGQFTAGLYSGLNFHVFLNTPEGATACEEFIRGAGSKTDGIVAVFICPNFFIQNGSYPTRYTFTLGSRPTTIDGYTPRNKKLLTYPYSFIYATNLQGNYATYQYEYFYNPDDCMGVYYGVCTPSPSIMLMPNAYKGFNDDNPDEKLVMSGFPQIAYATDSYRAWLAQNAGSLGINAIANTLQGGLRGAIKGGAGGAALGASMNLLGSALNAVQQIYQHSIMPDQGHTGAGQEALAAARLLDFYVCNRHITSQFARIIDDFFDRFGYATNRIAIPNRTARKEWCYTKTIGCTLTGNIPGDDMRKICDIYDAGITFWKHPDNVGNYRLDNSPYAGW